MVPSVQLHLLSGWGPKSMEAMTTASCQGNSSKALLRSLVPIEWNSDFSRYWWRCFIICSNFPALLPSLTSSHSESRPQELSGTFEARPREGTSCPCACPHAQLCPVLLYSSFSLGERHSLFKAQLTGCCLHYTVLYFPLESTALPLVHLYCLLCQCHTGTFLTGL